MARDSVKVRVVSGADLARSMNESGKFASEVKAAAILRQGQSPSMAGASLGFGLWNVVKPRSDRELPRVFVLALADSEAIAFKARGVSVGDTDPDYYVTVWSEPLQAWPRSSVTIERAGKGINTNVVLHVGGETIPCSSQADETLLEAALGSAAAP